MLPDGKIKIAGALICKAEQCANKHKIEKGRHECIKIREAAQHLWEENQSGIP